jgi:hypothetical protein
VFRADEQSVLRKKSVRRRLQNGVLSRVKEMKVEVAEQEEKWMRMLKAKRSSGLPRCHCRSYNRKLLLSTTILPGSISRIS